MIDNCKSFEIIMFHCIGIILNFIRWPSYRRHNVSGFYFSQKQMTKRKKQITKEKKHAINMENY